MKIEDFSKKRLKEIKDFKFEIQVEDEYFKGNNLISEADRESNIQTMIETYKVYSFIRQYISFPNFEIKDKYKFRCPKELSNILIKEWDENRVYIKNLTSLLESKGFLISSINTNKKKSKAFAIKLLSNNYSQYIIALGNDKRSITTRNYDLALILGHIFFKDESKAQEFADEFLLPEDKVYGEVGNIRELDDLIEIKIKFVVPIKFIIERIYKLNIISKKKYDYLCKEYKSCGWNKKEPLDDAKSPNPTLGRTCIELLLKEKILNKNSIIGQLKDYGVNIYSYNIEEILGLKKGYLNSNEIPNKELKLSENIIQFKR